MKPINVAYKSCGIFMGYEVVVDTSSGEEEIVEENVIVKLSRT